MIDCPTAAVLTKVELHLHLEGAAPPEFIRRLSDEKGIDPGSIFDANGHYAFHDFLDFLRVCEAATAVLTTPDDYHRLTRAGLAESAAHNVIYTEAFLSPDFCGGADPAAWRDYLAAIREAAIEAERDHAITFRAIATCIRHFGPEPAERVAFAAPADRTAILNRLGAS